MLFASNRTRLIITSIISFLLTYYLWGPNLKARWWIIDDSGIMQTLGDDGKLGIKEIPKLLLDSEVGHWGKSLRYRPTYWTLNHLECFLWGNSPALWYMCRFLIFFSSAAIFLYVLQHRIGLLYGTIFLVFAISAKYWIDIFAKLGPAEIYATIGTALYFLGFYHYLQFLMNTPVPPKTLLSTRSNAILMTIGAIISIGSKENFTILVLPSVFLIVYAYLKKKSNLFLYLNVLMVTLYGLFVLLAILLAVNTSGADIYANDVTIQGRCSILFDAIPKLASDLKIYVSCPAMLLLGFAVYFLKNPKFIPFLIVLKNFAVAFILTSFIYLSQIVFYNGNWPNGSRYDFPGVLANHLFLLYTLMCLVNVAKLFILSKAKLHTFILSATLLVFTFVFPLPEIVEQLQDIRTGSVNNANRSRSFMEIVEEVVAEAQKHPEFAILFDSFHAFDFEPVDSVGRFLRAHNVKNPMYLRINGYSENSETDKLGKLLAARLVKVSRNGSENDSFNFGGFKPLSALRFEDKRYIVVSFSGSNPTTCKNFRIWR
jgi:hypothetical protein